MDGVVTATAATKIVPQLSKPLRRAVLALDDQRFTDWNRVLRQRPQRIKLNALGLTEPQVIGPVTLWFNIRLTPLGRQVKGLLKADSAAISRARTSPEQNRKAATAADSSGNSLR